jgi:hypothetical protein
MLYLDMLEHAAADLLEPSRAGLATDWEACNDMELLHPNTLRAWSHAVPALEKFAKNFGRRGFFGQDKGEKAFNLVMEKMLLVVAALYADGLLAAGDPPEKCQWRTVATLAMFKDVFPNWQVAYGAGHRLFVVEGEHLRPILQGIQQSVEEDNQQR